MDNKGKTKWPGVISYGFYHHCVLKLIKGAAPQVVFIVLFNKYRERLKRPNAIDSNVHTSINEISRLTNLAWATVSNAIDKLKEIGLLSYSCDGKDKICVTINGDLYVSIVKKYNELKGDNQEKFVKAFHATGFAGIRKMIDVIPGCCQEISGMAGSSILLEADPTLTNEGSNIFKNLVFPLSLEKSIELFQLLNSLEGSKVFKNETSTENGELLKSLEGSKVFNNEKFSNSLEGSKVFENEPSKNDEKLLKSLEPSKVFNNEKLTEDGELLKSLEGSKVFNNETQRNDTKLLKTLEASNDCSKVFNNLAQYFAKNSVDSNEFDDVFKASFINFISEDEYESVKSEILAGNLKNVVKLHPMWFIFLGNLVLNFLITPSKVFNNEGQNVLKNFRTVININKEKKCMRPSASPEPPVSRSSKPESSETLLRVEGVEKGMEEVRKSLEEVRKGLENVRDLFLDFSPSHPLQKLPAPSEKEGDPSDTELPADDKEGEDKPDIFAYFKKLPDVDFTFGKGSEEQEGEEGEELPADREEESQAPEAFQPTEEELREETRRDAEYVRSRSPYKNKPYLERSVIKECVTGLGERIDYATDLFVHIFVRYAWEAWYDMVGPEHEDPSEPSEGAASQEDAFKKKIPTADDFLRMDGMELPLETAMQCARNAYDDLLGWNSQRAYIGPDGKRRPFSPDLPETEAEELEWMYACDFEVRTDRDRTKHVTIDFGRFRDVLAADVREDVPSRGKDKALRKRENAAYRDLLLAEGAKPESPLEAMQLGFYRTFCGLGLENRVDVFHDAKGYELIPGTKFPEHLLRPWCARREYDANYKDFTSSLWKPYSGLDGISRGPFLFDARKTARWSELRGHSDGLAAKAIEAAAGMPKEEWEE